ncbi:helix-turn-helix domain-containing protein [Azospirillum sp.]|uniref:helix-turn-helix domain-containing protein n=1 Tax=Azospirillum sp. TaxID=34012 RepID=UPI003D75DBFD
MIPQRTLPDLLSAERGLGRFDALLSDTARARRHACDATRRSVLAMAALDGELVGADDLLLALISPDEVDLPRRAKARTAALLYDVLLALHGRITATPATPEDVPTDGRLRPETVAAWSSIAGETRRLLAEAEAALTDYGTDEPTGEEPPQVHALTAWTLPWLEEVHARWYEARHSQLPAPWTASAREISHDALRLIDEALVVDPGLAGAARALYRLHGAREELRPAPIVVDEDEPSRAIRRHIAGQTHGGWWAHFARLAAPHLIARACRLNSACLPMVAWWSRDHTGYRTALGGSEDNWITWMAGLAAEAVGAEIERSAQIEARHESWVAATSVVPRLPKRRSDTRGPTRRQRAGTRRSTGRLPQLLDFLWEQPMVSTRAVERRLGMTYRSALDLIQDLEAAGVLQRATERKLDRLWRATIV